MSFSQIKKENNINHLLSLSSKIQELENTSQTENAKISDLTLQISLEISEISQKLKSEPSKFVKLRLQKDFTLLVNRFENFTKFYNNNSKQKSTHTSAFKGSTLDNSFNAFNDSDHEKTPLLQNQSQKEFVQLEHEIEFNEALIQEREQDLESIEKSVAQVNEIFRDLGTLVHEQQYMLDNIESNVASVAVNAENATSELRQANQYALKSRKRILCLLSTALIVLAVLVLMLQPWRWK